MTKITASLWPLFQDPFVYIDVPARSHSKSGGTLFSSSTGSDVMVSVSSNATVGVHAFSALDRAGMNSHKTKNDFLVEVDPTFVDAAPSGGGASGGENRYC